MHKNVYCIKYGQICYLSQALSKKGRVPTKLPKPSEPEGTARSGIGHHPSSKLKESPSCSWLAQFSYMVLQIRHVSFCCFAPMSEQKNRIMNADKPVMDNFTSTICIYLFIYSFYFTRLNTGDTWKISSDHTHKIILVTILPLFFFLQTLEQDLGLCSSSTRKLIERYYQQKIQQQVKGPNTRYRIIYFTA